MSKVKKAMHGVRLMSKARLRWQRAVWAARVAVVFSSVERWSGAGNVERPDLAHAEQRRELRAAFDLVDTDGGGTLSVDEIRTLLEALGQTNTEAELRAKIRDIDVDGSGTLDFEEFVTMMERWQAKELEDMFNFFNVDGDESISFDELRAAVGAVGQTISDEAFRDLVAAVDKDGSGDIDAREFCAFMRPLMNFTQKHTFAVRALPDGDELQVTISTMGAVLSGHATVPFVGFPLHDETAKPAVGLVACSADEAKIRIEVSNKGAADNLVVLLEARNATDASLLVEKILQAAARKALRKKVAHSKQLLALKEAFDDMDLDGSNELDINELSELLMALGHEFTQAELRDRARQLDEDGSGKVEFNEFVTLMTAWQQEELQEMFHYFDDDLSGNMDTNEIRSCLSALGKNMTPEEVASLTAQVDVDGSGAIDADEFIVFMKPFMHIGQKYQYKLRQIPDEIETVVSISTIGIQLGVGASKTRLGFGRIKAFYARPDAPATLVLEVSDVDSSKALAFSTDSAGLCADIVGLLEQQIAKRRLRRNVQLHKQKIQLREAFVAVDTSGDGRLDLDELRRLLQTLGQEVTDAALRDKVRKLTGGEASESIDFEQFASWMSTWQEEEMGNVFDFFDDDSTGTISVSELSECIQALGKNIDAEEALEMAKHVDSDGSGKIDREEFFVFIRPMMSVSQRTDYIVQRVEDGAVQSQDTTLSVGLLGIQLTNAQVQFSYSFFALVRIDESPLLTLTILQSGEEKQMTFQAQETSSIVANVHQQQARLQLIQDIRVDRQQRELKLVFDMFDDEGSGEIATDEVKVLLQTLGQDLAEDEIKSRIKRYDTDNSGAISFDEFAVWMADLQDQEMEDAFYMFDKDRSGSISVPELQQLIRTMGERMTDSEVAQLAKHVDSDGSGQMDMDELKLLLRPMMSMADHAKFSVELEPNSGICGGTVDLVVSGLGIQFLPQATTNPVNQEPVVCDCVQCQRVTTTLSYTKIVDFRERDRGLSILAKARTGELSKALVVCENFVRDEILAAVKRQQGKLSLRSAIAQSKEPNESSIGTAFIILQRDPKDRTKTQLRMLHQFLADSDMFTEMELATELQQLQCCRYLRAERFAAGDVIFEEGSVMWDVYHVLEGVISIRKDGVEARRQWKGASFGALTVNGEHTAGRSPTLVCVVDCFLVKLTRSDYLRICGGLEDEVIRTLSVPTEDRTEADLTVVLGLFHDAQFFKVLYYELLQRACCRVMQLHQVGQGTTIATEDKGRDTFGVILNGRVEITTTGRGSNQLLCSGDAIGFECLMGRTKTERQYSSTAVAIENTKLGALSRDEFIHVSGSIGESIVQILEKRPSTRSLEDIEMIHGLFSQLPFMTHLRSTLLQHQCCRHFTCRRILEGEVLFKQGDVGDAMYIVLSGSMCVHKWRAANNKRGLAARRGEVRCQIGATFGERSLLAKSEFEQRRNASLKADEDAVLAVLSREMYIRIKQTSQLQLVINQFWEMIMNDAFGHARNPSTDFCAEGTYKKLHLAIGKSIHSDWTSMEALDEVERDWSRDIARHNSGNDVLNHHQFSDAMYELVDEWCGTISVHMYVSFLSSVFDNIKRFWMTDEKSGQDKFVLDNIDDINCIDTSLRQLQEEGNQIRKRDEKELDKIYKAHRSKAKSSGRTAVFRTVSTQRVQHILKGDSLAIKKTHIQNAEAQLKVLRDQFGATFASEQEMAYFKELLALRVLGPPKWTEDYEETFRLQLHVNIDGLDSERLAKILDQLQECIIAGSPRDDAVLGTHRVEAQQALDSMLSSKGLTIDDRKDGAHEHAIREVMRRQAGPPYWLAKDEENFNKMLDGFTIPAATGTAMYTQVSRRNSSTDSKRLSEAEDEQNAPDSPVMWGQKRRLPGGFTGRIGTRMSDSNTASKVQLHRKNVEIDLTHVVAKVDTGNVPRRRRKRDKNASKKVRRRRPSGQRAKAKSMTPSTAHAGRLPSVKRSASVPLLPARNEDANSAPKSKKKVRKRANRKLERQLCKAEPVAVREHPPINRFTSVSPLRPARHGDAKGTVKDRSNKKARRRAKRQQGHQPKDERVAHLLMLHDNVRATKVNAVLALPPVRNRMTLVPKLPPVLAIP